MCSCLHMAASTYYAYQRCQKHPQLRSPRVKRDEALCEQISRAWDKNYQVYGVKKVWHQLLNEGVTVARCTISRLMKRLGIAGIRRGKRIKTIMPNQELLAVEDKVKRVFNTSAPNLVWVADFTYVPTWQGFAYVAYVIDVFARRILGWKLSHHMKAQFVKDALEQALYQRRPNKQELIHHSDKGAQYTAISCYTQRLKEAGIEPSVGKTGCAYDNALAETINGLYKTEITKRKRWETHTELELATLEWVHWYNQKRLLSSIGNISPVKAEQLYYDQITSDAKNAV